MKTVTPELETQGTPSQPEKIVIDFIIDETGTPRMPVLVSSRNEESASRMPRDATVIAILPPGSSESAIALGNLRRRGFAVTAILNLHDEWDFALASAPFLTEGVQTQHLKDETSIMEICRAFALR